jgi:hypothetical protein
MDKIVDLAIATSAFIGGLLVASGLFAHLSLIARLGLPLERQASVGGVLLAIALVVYFAMGGRLAPRRR